MTALRIGVLTHIKFPVRQPFAGGLEAFTFDVVTGLAARGHEVTLFAHEGSDPSLNLVPMADPHPHRHPSLSSAYVAEHHAYLEVMQGIDAHGFDVIFNNSLHYVPVTMASLIRTPMLTVLHTPPFFELVNALKGPRAHGRFATISAANARNWQGLVPECAVVPNGIDLEAWRPTGEPREQAFWFGRLVADKGAHLAIDAARAAGVPLRLAGQAPDARYFSEYISPRLGAGVEYLGHLGREQVLAELGQASVVLVTPCWEEPFGLVVAEAMACGTPVAAFARGAMADLISADTGALAAPGDVAALAEALRSAQRCSRQACRTRAEAHWGQGRMLDAYAQLLRVVAHG
ncbi:glycosyltransferase [Pseudomonas sp. NPDC007930]|uniref:glycosyltransferase family 4 protein n=1 Tax=Pseudomonas sp. NPDC007930 TaxID=3364417 RepID=UPI0036EEFBA9